ncbi:WCX domain-containing protein [Streptomyces sp. SD15]
MLLTPQRADTLPAADDTAKHVELEMHFRSLGAAQQLLAFGTVVEVISPAEPRESLARVAEEIAAVSTHGLSQ